MARFSVSRWWLAVVPPAPDWLASASTSLGASTALAAVDSDRATRAGGKLTALCLALFVQHRFLDVRNLVGGLDDSIWIQRNAVNSVLH